MELLIVNQTRLKIVEKTMTAMVSSIITALTDCKKIKNSSFLKRQELTVVFVGEAKMKTVNHQYRGKNYATDVLSFSSVDQESLGELVFCMPVLKKQAVRMGHSAEHEFLYMCIHGVLHLLGYDHETGAKDEKIMFDLQNKLFSELTQKKIKLKLFYVN